MKILDLAKKNFNRHKNNKNDKHYWYWKGILDGAMMQNSEHEKTKKYKFDSETDQLMTEYLNQAIENLSLKKKIDLMEELIKLKKYGEIS